MASLGEKKSEIRHYSCFPMVIAAGGQAAAGNITWLTILIGLVGILGTAGTIYGGIIASQKTRLETRKLQRELADAKDQPSVVEPGAEPTTPLATGTRTQRAIAVSIEGYVIRFILLYLVYEIVGFFLNAIQPLLGFSTYFLRGAPVPLQYAVGISGSYVSLIINVIVFLALGLPLFKDILSSLGLRPSELFSKRLGKEVISLSNSNARDDGLSTGQDDVKRVSQSGQG